MADTIFEYIEIEGTPREIGLQQGEAFKRQIRGSIKTYTDMFRDYSNLEWDRAKELSRYFIPMIEEFNHDYIEEMQGVAEGAGLDFEDILALNCRSELVFVGAEMDKQDGGCTSIGVSSDVGANGHCYVAHNWDWKTSQRPNEVMMKVKQTNGKPTFLTITEAGIIGKTGFNSAGISVVLNALSTNQSPAGIPLHMAMRAILDAETLFEAIGVATKMPLGCCASFLIGSRGGEVINLEIENEDFDVLYPSDGIIVHTNHFLSPRLPRYPRKDTTKYKLPDSFVRCGRADKLARAKGTDIGPDDLKEILKDHTEWPCSICRHDNPKIDPGLSMGTVFSIIIDHEAGDVYFCKGNPCETDYELYHVSQE
ncbi:MAG: hypothetical protein IJ125_06615 [Atopobiaceae bacterium]|nr:hypothetical protein [Atopobiaceae bacterium]